MSQTTPTERTIDGFTYQVLKMPPLEAHDVLIDLGTTVFPALGNLFACMMGGGEEEQDAKDLWDLLDKAGNPDQMAEAFKSLATAIATNKTLFKNLMSRLASLTDVTLAEGKAPRLNSVFDSHFMGRLPSMYRWFAFALEVQFGNFFELLPNVTGLGDRLKNLR